MEGAAERQPCPTGVAPPLPYPQQSTLNNQPTPYCFSLKNALSPVGSTVMVFLSPLMVTGLVAVTQ